MTNLINIKSLDLSGAGGVTSNQILENTLLNEMSLQLIN